MTDFNWIIAWEVSVTKIDNKVAESEEQDQTARMCSLILIYTFHKLNLWP